MSASAGGTPTPRPSPGGPARPAQLPEEGPGRDPAPASRQPAAGLTLLGPQVRGGAVQLLEAQQRGLQVGTCNREGVRRRPGPAGGTGSGAERRCPALAPYRPREPPSCPPHVTRRRCSRDTPPRRHVTQPERERKTKPRPGAHVSLSPPPPGGVAAGRRSANLGSDGRWAA